MIVATLPGEQVGVMFDVQIDDLAPSRHGFGQEVQRISGITGKNHDVVSSGPQEPMQRRSR